MHTEMLERMDWALDHALTRDEARELEEHLAKCEMCAANWDALSVVHRKLAIAPRLAPRAGFTQRVLQRAAAQERERTRRSQWAGVGVLVAGSAILYGLAFFWSPFGTLLEPGTWVTLVDSALSILAVGSTWSIVIWTFASMVLQAAAGWPSLLIALSALVLAMLWTWMISGAPLNRLSRTTEV